MRITPYLEQNVWRNNQGCVGLKLMLGQRQTRRAFYAAMRLGAAPIFLTRAYKVRAILSAALARTLNKWWYFDQDHWEMPDSVTISPKDVDLYAHAYIDDHRWAERVLPKQTLYIRYENFPEDIERTLQWLDVPFQLKTEGETFPSRTPQLLWERVVNYAEMEKRALSHLKQSRLHWLRRRIIIALS